MDAHTPPSPAPAIERRRTPTDTQRLGRKGEDLAVAYLRRRGWVILDRNWRCRYGELDIIAWDHGHLVVCEVKTRSGLRAGRPLEAITSRKLRRICDIASLWLAERGASTVTLRIDALGIRLTGAESCTIEHVRGVR